MLWVLVFAAYSPMMSHVLVAPPLGFRTEERCIEAAQHLETRITDGVKGIPVEFKWECVKRGKQV